MGDWIILITGQGKHHNGDHDDANEIAKKVIAELKENKHRIFNAEFIQIGSRTEELCTT